MIYISNLKFLALALSPLLLVNAQNCSSTNDFDTGYNATGSVSTPGFRVNESYPASTWTWTRYIVDKLSPSNRTFLWQTFGLETSPVQDLRDPSLPYTACAIALTGIANTGKVASENGSCNSVLTSDCIRQIISQVNLTASQWSNTAVASSSTLECLSLLGSISVSKGSACYGQWDGSISTRFMPRNFTASANTTCPVTNPGASNSTSRSFFAWSPGSTASDNYTFYDQAVRNAQPLIVAGFLKSTNTSNGGTTAWADTRLLCLPGNVTTPGSRNITEANKTAGAARIGGITAGMFGIVALTTLLGLL